MSGTRIILWFNSINSTWCTLCFRLIFLGDMTRSLDTNRKNSVAFNNVMEEIEIEDFKQFNTEDKSEGFTAEDLREEVGPFISRPNGRLSCFSRFSVSSMQTVYSTYQYGFLIISFCMVFTMGLVVGVFLHMFFLCFDSCKTR